VPPQSILSPINIHVLRGKASYQISNSHLTHAILSYHFFITKCRLAISGKRWKSLIVCGFSNTHIRWLKRWSACRVWFFKLSIKESKILTSLIYQCLCESKSASIWLCDCPGFPPIPQAFTQWLPLNLGRRVWHAPVPQIHHRACLVRKIYPQRRLYLMAINTLSGRPNMAALTNRKNCST